MSDSPTARTAHRRRRRTLRAALLPGATAVALVAAACSGGDAPAVTTAVVSTGDVVELVDAPGSVAARATATVTAAAGGTVDGLAVSDGQQVRVGQVLLRLRSPQAQSQLQQAREADDAAASSSGAPTTASGLSSAQRRSRDQALAGFASARKQADAITDPAVRAQAVAALDQAREQYSLLAAQTDQIVRQVDAGLRSVDAAVRSLTDAQRLQTRAAVAAAQSVVDSLLVRAPISGRVSLSSGAGGGGGGLPAGAAQLLQQGGVDLGAAAGAAGGGSAPTQGATTLAVGTPVASGATLATVTDASVLSLTAEVDETDVLQVRPGTRADVSVDAVPAATYAATVRSVDPAPTTGTAGSVSYTARLSLDGGSLDGAAAPPPLPGMSAVVSLKVAQAKKVARVPASAVVRGPRGGADGVWVVAAGRVRFRPVSVGLRGETLVEVRNGVRPGERVVVKGTDGLDDGQQVS